MWDGFSTRPRPRERPPVGGGRVENPSHISTKLVRESRSIDCRGPRQRARARQRACSIPPIEMEAHMKRVALVFVLLVIACTSAIKTTPVRDTDYAGIGGAIRGVVSDRGGTP